MKKVSIEQLEHLGIIYCKNHYTLSRFDVRFVMNPQRDRDFFETYRMSETANDPCLKIFKKNVLVCANREENEKTKTFQYLRKLFKDKFVNNMKTKRCAKCDEPCKLSNKTCSHCGGNKFYYIRREDENSR